MKLSQVQMVAGKVHEILVVDADGKSADAIRRASPTGSVVRVAKGIDQALCELQHKPVDLVVVNLQVGDNAGVQLLERIKRAYPATTAVAMSRSQAAEACVEAWRAGASDIVFSPLKVEETRQVIEGSLRKTMVLSQQSARQRRLRTVCKRLNKARHEISQQVDLLCNDLVRAYQDLAQQLNQTQAIADFATAIEGHRGLEGLMRASMEWVLKKLGPVNAAVFLPDSEGNYSLGAYLNLDTAAEEGFIEAIGSTLALQGAAGGVVHLENDQQISDMFGNPGAALRGKTWMAHGCFLRQECLGVLTLFRSNGVPIDASLATLLQAITPVLAEKIAQTMHQHNRISQLERHEDGNDDGNEEAL